MSHKPTGQLLGNVKDTGLYQDAPGNAANSGLPTTHPEGARFLSFGEGARSANFNRALTALGTNIDRLFTKLTRSLALPTRLTSNEVPTFVLGAPANTITLKPAGFPTQSTGFDGWIYHGQTSALLPNYFRILSADDGMEVTVDSNEVRVTGVQQHAADALAAKSVAVSASNLAISKPAAVTDARHILELGADLARIGTASAKGLRVHIQASTATTADKGNNDGVYTIADTSEITPLKTFILREAFFRIRVKSWSAGDWSIGDVVIGESSGAKATVRAAYGSDPGGKGADYLEFDSLTLGTAFWANEIVHREADPNDKATVVYARAPGDPVILNNDMSAAGNATFYTDGNFSVHVNDGADKDISLQLNKTLPAGTYIVVCGTRTSLYELPVPGLIEGGSTSSVDDFSSVIAELGLEDHTDGGNNKHDASEIDFEDTGGADNLVAGSVEATIDAIDAKMGALSALATAAKGSLKDAINEVDANADTAQAAADAAQTTADQGVTDAATAQAAAVAAQTTADAAIPASEKAAVNGVATLGAGGKLPATQFDDTAHGNRGGGSLHPDVVAAGASGFMTGADKTKLNGIASGANNYSLSKSKMQTAMGDDSSNFDINGAILANSNLKAQEGTSDHLGGSYSGAIPELDGASIAPGFVRGHCVLLTASEAMGVGDIVAVLDNGGAVKCNGTHRIPLGVVRKAALINGPVLVQVSGMVVVAAKAAVTIARMGRVVLAAPGYDEVTFTDSMSSAGVLGIALEKYDNGVGGLSGARLVRILLMPSGTTT